MQFTAPMAVSTALAAGRAVTSGGANSYLDESESDSAVRSPRIPAIWVELATR